MTLGDEEHSRWLNAVTGGDPEETFCARCWRERWRRPWFWLVIWHIDRAAMHRFGEEPGHCRRAALNHRIRVADPDDLRRLLDS